MSESAGNAVVSYVSVYVDMDRAPEKASVVATSNTTRGEEIGRSTDPPGFVEREIALIQRALREPQPPERYAQLMAANQALGWVLEPSGYASPYDSIMRKGSHEG